MCILALTSVVTSVWHPGALSLLLGNVSVGELAVDDLDHIFNPLSSSCLGLLAWVEGSALLGCVPEEGLDPALGQA